MQHKCCMLVFQPLWCDTLLITRGLYWQRASIRDGHAAKISMLYILLRLFEKKIVPLNSANFSISDLMDKMHLWKPICFVGLGFPHLGVLDIWWVETLPLKAHLPSVCCFPLMLLVCIETFPVLCTWHRKCRYFGSGSGSAHVKNFRNVSRQQSPPPKHLWVYHRQLYIPRIVVHFRY